MYVLGAEGHTKTLGGFSIFCTSLGIFKGRKQRSRVQELPRSMQMSREYGIDWADAGHICQAVYAAEGHREMERRMSKS